MGLMYTVTHAIISNCFTNELIVTLFFNAYCSAFLGRKKLMCEQDKHAIISPQCSCSKNFNCDPFMKKYGNMSLYDFTWMTS